MRLRAAPLPANVYLLFSKSACVCTCMCVCMAKKIWFSNQPCPWRWPVPWDLGPCCCDTSHFQRHVYHFQMNWEGQSTRGSVETEAHSQNLWCWLLETSPDFLDYSNMVSRKVWQPCVICIREWCNMGVTTLMHAWEVMFSGSAGAIRSQTMTDPHDATSPAHTTCEV